VIPPARAHDQAPSPRVPRGGWRILALAFCAGFLLAPVAFASDLRADVDRVLSDPGLGSIRKGARILDLGTGRVVSSYHADELFIPASNAKIVTAAAALDRLGSDFCFVTRFYARGPVRDGTLAGDLVLWGNGDPNISGRFYDDDPLHLPRKWIRELRALGITRVRGSLVVDDHAFDRVFRHPDWNPAESDFWYQAPVSALSFNDNCIDLLIRPASPGALAVVALKPDTRYVHLTNKLKTVSSGATSIRIDRNAPNTLIVAGTVRARSGARTMWTSVDQPALFLATVLSEEFTRQGGVIEGGIRLADSPVVGRDRSLQLLFEERSTIAGTLAVMNTSSKLSDGSVSVGAPSRTASAPSRTSSPSSASSPINTSSLTDRACPATRD